MSKALRTLQPILLQGNINGISICRLHRADDLLVLFHGDMEVLDDRTRIEAPVTLRLRLDAAVQSCEARPGAILSDEAVKVPIDLEDLAGMAALSAGNRVQPVIERPKLRPDLLALSLRKIRHAAAGNSLKAADD